MITKTRKISTSKNLVSSIKKTIRINKSNEIRKIALKMSKNGGKPKGNNIIKALAKKDINVSSSHVSYALNRKRMKAKIKNVKCSVNDIVAAKEFIDKMGGFEKAQTAIRIYKKFK